MTKNRRTDKRKSKSLIARWEGLSGQHEARIEDIGMGGCFVTTVTRVEVGEIVALEIGLPSGGWLNLQGEVTFCQEAVGFGLRFTSLTEDDQSVLTEVLD